MIQAVTTLGLLRPPERATPAIQTGWNEDLIRNLQLSLNELTQQVKQDATPIELRTFESKAKLQAATVAAVTKVVLLTGFTTAGDGGGAFYKRVGADPAPAISLQSADADWWELVPAPSGLDAMQAGATGDGATDDATALADFFNAGPMSNVLTVSQGTYLTGTALVSDDNLHFLNGMGFSRDVSGNILGSVIKASGTGVADLLAIQSLTPASGDTTNLGHVKVTNLAFFHRGSGIGLLIDNITRLRMENVFIECNSEGAIGMKIDNFGFFATVENVNIWNFTDVGLLVVGDGTQHIIRSSHFTSSNNAATAALEFQVGDFLVDGGQYNVDRADDTGIGILVNNPETFPMRFGGRINNTLCESGIAVKITGTTDQVYSTVVNEPSWSLNSSAVQIGIIFDRARYCRLINPQINDPTGGGVLAEWTTNSVDCGVICNIQAAKGALTVNSGADQPWMFVTGRITITERNNITTDTNLTVTCEDVKNVGRNVHNGIAWDGDWEFKNDDKATSFLTPYAEGVVEIISDDLISGYALVQYKDTTGTNSEALTLGSNTVLDTSDGSLADLDGADTKLTIRYNSSDNKIYLSNRLGANAGFGIKFRAGQQTGAS